MVYPGRHLFIMKIAITIAGNDWDSPVEARFGRARQFALVDTEADTFELHDNQQNLQAAQGAGIQSAQRVVELDVEAVISGHCGPKAFQVLKAAGIRIYTAQDLTVREAVEKLKAGELPEAAAPDVAGHWI